MTDESGEQFRARVRDWCGHHVPKSWRATQADADEDAEIAFQRQWRDTLRAGGFLAPAWPRNLGGCDLPLDKQAVLAEEMARADAPRLSAYQVAIFNAAPAILHFGTDDQQRRFLTGILDGEVWCQGFSEPGAGSDLAALSTIVLGGVFSIRGLTGVRVTDRFTTVIGQQILLRDIGDIGSLVIFSQ